MEEDRRLYQQRLIQKQLEIEQNLRSNYHHNLTHFRQEASIGRILEIIAAESQETAHSGLVRQIDATYPTSTYRTGGFRGSKQKKRCKTKRGDRIVPQKVTLLNSYANL